MLSHFSSGAPSHECGSSTENVSRSFTPNPCQATYKNPRPPLFQTSFSSPSIKSEMRGGRGVRQDALVLWHELPRLPRMASLVFHLVPGRLSFYFSHSVGHSNFTVKDLLQSFHSPFNHAYTPSFFNTFLTPIALEREPVGGSIASTRS